MELRILNAIIFVNPPSLMIVVGGTTAVILMKFPTGVVFNSLRVMKKAFYFHAPSAVEIINQIIEMAMLARKEGVLALVGTNGQQVLKGATI